MKRWALPVALLTALAAVHAQIWLGRGSVAHVAELRAQLAQQIAANQALQADNAHLTADVRDLIEGLDLIEEKARLELGMVRPDEVFVQYGH